MLGHGQDNLGGQRHHYCLQIGSPLLMWDRRTVCGSLEKIAHSDFDLPMTAIALTGRYLPSSAVLRCSPVCAWALWICPELLSGCASYLRSSALAWERAHDKTRRSAPASNFLSKSRTQNKRPSAFFTGYIIHLFCEKCKIEFYSAQPKLVPFPGDFSGFPGRNSGFSPLCRPHAPKRLSFILHGFVHPAQF